jgi:hypothetical protein
MSWLFELHLIRLFNFYLAAIFVIGTFVRWRQYQIFLILMRAMPNRWPRLMQLVKQYRHVFVTWGTILPLALMLGLLVLNWVATNFIWPEANFTLGDLCRLRPALVVVGVSSVAMIAFDTDGLVRSGTVDRAQMESYFDQAEYWLRSWAAPVVRIFTLGYIHPRRMVRDEVQKALVSASLLLNSTLWWVITQTGLRIAYGLSLWGTYFLFFHPRPVA